MAAEPHHVTMRVEEYLEFLRDSPEVRYEFIDGQLYMLAGGTTNHSLIAANMIRELGFLLRGGPCRVYTSDMLVQVSENRFVFPDVVVSCDERDRGVSDMLRYPRMIVEVLSPSTERRDRGKKFSYYRACPTIQEYILVETDEQAVEVYRRATENLWTLHFFGADDNVELASLKVRFPVAALYENVDFPEDAPDDPPA